MLMPEQLTVPRPPGRLPVSCPDVDIRCGNVEAETTTFFDFIATPPWDTWVAFLDRLADESELTVEPQQRLDATGARSDLILQPCLLAWIPAAFEDLAQRGIEADPYGCLTWLDLCPGELATVLTRGAAEPRSVGPTEAGAT